MCTAKRHIMLFAIFTNSWRETIENNNIFWCTIYAQFQTWPWTNRGTTYPGRGKTYPERGTTYLGRGTAYPERRQAYQSCHFFPCYSKIWDPAPQKSATIWILLMAQEFKNIQFWGYLLYPWSLFRSFVVYWGFRQRPIPVRTCDCWGIRYK